jgi:putative phosphonate catabolism associated alcohol dehydrogenase
MQTSKIAVFNSPNSALELQSVAVPFPDMGEILVKVEYTTLCGSDLKTFTGARREKTPTILGHEIVGRIAAFGPNALHTDERGQRLMVDDLITWAIYCSEPHSELAHRGIPQKGPGLFKYGHEQLTPTCGLHGGLAEFILLRPNTPIVKFRKPVPLPVLAPVNCAVATIAGAFRLAGSVAGKNVLICGVGMLGLVACAMARSKDAKTIVALDVDEDRLEAARQFGADLTVVSGSAIAETLRMELGQTRSIDLIIECSGVTEVMEAGLNWLGIGGTAVWVGATYPAKPVAVDAEQLLRNVLTIKGLHNYNAGDLVAAVEFMEQYHADFPFAGLIYDGFTLDAVDEAFAYAIRERPYRVGITI